MKVDIGELEVLADNLFPPLARLKVALKGFEDADRDAGGILPEQLDDTLSGSETKEVTSAVAGLKVFLPLSKNIDFVATSLGSLEKEITSLRMKLKLLREECDKDPRKFERVVKAHELGRLLNLDMVDICLGSLEGAFGVLETSVASLNTFGQQIVKTWKESEAKGDTGWRGGKLNLLLMHLYRQLSVFQIDGLKFRNSMGQLDGALKQIHAKIEEIQK
jgi:hypothetical protein